MPIYWHPFLCKNHNNALQLKIEVNEKGYSFYYAVNRGQMVIDQVIVGSYISEYGYSWWIYRMHVWHVCYKQWSAHNEYSEIRLVREKVKNLL